jgi:hypothetical protein
MSGPVPDSTKTTTATDPAENKMVVLLDPPGKELASILRRIDHNQEEVVNLITALANFKKPDHFIQGMFILNDSLLITVSKQFTYQNECTAFVVNDTILRNKVKRSAIMRF